MAVVNRASLWQAILIVGLAAAAACGGAVAIVPENTAAPMVVPDGGPTRTPSPAKEWKIEGMKHAGTNGEDAVVTIRYFSTASVTVTYDSREPDERVFDPPLEHFTFRGVERRGTHAVVARDTMGLEETINFSYGPKSGSAPSGSNQ